MGNVYSKLPSFVQAEFRLIRVKISRGHRLSNRDSCWPIESQNEARLEKAGILGGKSADRKFVG